MKVSELTGAMLDYWVARAEGYEYVDVPPDADGKNAGRALLPPGLLDSGWKFPPKGPVGDWVKKYSSNWETGGPIIEREKIAIRESDGVWVAWHKCGWTFNGQTPLVAAMRTHVASKFGGTVPDTEAA